MPILVASRGQVDRSIWSRKALLGGVVEHAASVETAVNSDEVEKTMAGAEEEDGQCEQ